MMVSSPVGNDPIPRDVFNELKKEFEYMKAAIDSDHFRGQRWRGMTTTTATPIHIGVNGYSAISKADMVYSTTGEHLEFRQNATAPIIPIRAALEATADLDTIEKLTSAIVDNYGAAEMEKSAAVSDKLLAFVGQEAGTEFSDKLGNLILVAKGLDPAEAEKQRTWWRRLLNFFGVQTETAAAQFKMVDAQITTLAGELKNHSDRQRGRHTDLEKLFDENRKAYEEIGALVNKGRTYLQRQKDVPVAEVVTGMEAQDIADRKALAQRLDKRLTDLDVAMTLMLQTAPEIRIMQANANALVDKFTTLTKLTIPALKKQFALHVLQVEQKGSAVIADAVDDATNDAFKKNATALHDNTVQVAKSGQRQIMEVATVEFVQKELLRTIDDVRQINADASAARAGVAAKLTTIRHDLITSTAGQHIQALEYQRDFSPVLIEQKKYANDINTNQRKTP